MTTFYVLADSGVRRIPVDNENYIFLPTGRIHNWENCDFEVERRPEDYAILTLECVLVKQGDTGHAGAGNIDPDAEEIGNGGVVL